MFLIGLSSTYAQIGELGIYGSVPEEDAEDIYYVYLQPYPAWYEAPPNHFRPVNGLGNFNFYYLPDGTGFIPSGSYRVWYYGADQTTTYGYDVVNYASNSNHTAGHQIRPFNIPDPEPKLPLGIYGDVRGYNAEGEIVDLYGLEVMAFDLSPGQGRAKTNGNGFFSIYYGTTGLTGFLETGRHPTLWIMGDTPDGCHYFKAIPGADIIWAPNNTPGTSGYYVSGANWSIGTHVLNCSM